ncbi:hypothetical protein ACFFX0_06465 [Citricoccus parietis]|uniref:Uncharacterized protein n=1 Tax=Citricoccus parietis TaxID=592307 RepID=A0ABV5FVZ9_9MICC
MPKLVLSTRASTARMANSGPPESGSMTFKESMPSSLPGPARAVVRQRTDRGGTPFG